MTTRTPSPISTILYRKTIIPLAIIVVSAAALSVVAYNYSLSVADTIGDIASNDVRSNAAAQARDLSLILSTGIDSITTNLQILSSSPGVKGYNEESRILFDVSQNSTRQLTHYYMWLGQEGKVEWVTNTGINAENYIGLDRSYREYFSAPQLTEKPFFSDITITSDGIPRLYIAYPVIDRDKPRVSETQAVNQFRGVALAAIGLENIGNLLKQSSPFELQRNDVLLLDNRGVIIYSRDSWLGGKSIYQDSDEIILSGLADPVILSKYEEALEETARGNSFAIDFVTSDGKASTLSSAPVIVDGQRVWTVYVLAPHTLTADVRVLFDQQNVFSAIMLIVFGALAFGIAFFVLSSNRRLSAIVGTRTSELKHANESLEESNGRLAVLNEQLLSANEKLSINDRLQKEFINIASHEMKTPTQAILLHSDILQRKPQDAKKSIDAIVRNAARLQRLTNNILDVTKIESQMFKLVKERVNLKELISTAIGDFKAQTGNSIEFVYRGKDVNLEADRTRLSQVISNLLGNAVEFTKEGVISISTEESEEELEVTVNISDEGPGIDPEIMPRLFTKFATKSDKGTGLGLFIAKSIIEAHGGRIWAKNHVQGAGATVSFALPLSSPAIKISGKNVSASPST